MSVYQEYFHWSPTLDCQAARLSMVDDRGQEFWRVVPRTRGQSWRVTRERELGYIQEAIDAGCEPGEVHVSILPA